MTDRDDCTNSFAASQGVIAAFEQQNNVQLNFIKSGDAGALALNRAILSKNAPLADVFYGVDNTFLSRASAQAFTSRSIAPGADPGANSNWTRATRPCRSIMATCASTTTRPTSPTRTWPCPQSFEDLLKPEYKGLLVMENPATSSPGLAFLLATHRPILARISTWITGRACATTAWWW